MPHDKHGRTLAVGDTVTITATVTQVHTGEEYCNVSLMTVEPMFPSEHGSPLSLNATQVELWEKAPPTADAPAPVTGS